MSKNSGIRKFVAAFDLHFGWEYRWEKGRRVVSATHSLPAIAALMQFVKDFRPNVFILGGDQLNCGPVSHWHKGRPRLDENFRLKDEMDLLDKYILQPLDTYPELTEKVWHNANHEKWLQDFIDENSGIEGLIEPENYLALKSRGWKILSQGEIYKLGKLHTVHGDVLKPGKNRAQKLVGDYRRNIRCGHFHTYEVATDVTPYDRSDFHTGIVVPAMAKVNAAYIKNGPSNHQQGFLYGWVAPDGSFTDHVMTIVKGKFLWNGKIYGDK